jgi:hypothetical protein
MDQRDSLFAENPGQLAHAVRFTPGSCERPGNAYFTPTKAKPFQSCRVRASGRTEHDMVPPGVKGLSQGQPEVVEIPIGVGEKHDPTRLVTVG